MNNSYLLVLTACIDPSTGPAHVVRKDPQTRLDDYSQAFTFWLSYPDPRVSRILFIENSGYSLGSLKQLVARNNPLSKEVEFISLCCNNYPPQVHYGYAELDMLDQGLSSSRLAQQSEYFIKATGRLKFPSLTRLLNHLPPCYSFAVDCRNNSLFRKSAQVFVTTQLMLFSKLFYDEQLYGIKSEMFTSHGHIEALLYDKLTKFSGRPNAILRWPVNCDPVGQAAHWQKDYASPKQRVINAGRAFCRVVLPKWWV